jgi:exonuclease V
MKKGSKIHKKLEDQLYDTVQVNIATKEDGWGLRLWNVIQGLRTLEKIGYTRELEVWGMIDGIPVNGVVDEVTIDCPDKELEARLDNRSNHGVKPLPAGQATLEQYLAGNGSTLHASTEAAESSSSRSTRRKIYICDVKTRSARSLPNAVAFRPTKMQLMLYHRLLGSLASNEVDFSILLGRYGLDGNRPFSDAFIAQIGNLDVTAAGEPHASSQSSQSSLDLFLENNSLTQLWSLMIATFQRVLPLGKQSLGRVLRAEYRSRDNGEVLGSRTLAMDDQVLDLYLNHELKWWKGERDPLGVVMEEAYKCNSCEFADLCDWRIARVEEAREKSRANKKAMKEVKKWEV